MKKLVEELEKGRVGEGMSALGAVVPVTSA
jgi:hypothetical protein